MLKLTIIPTPSPTRPKSLSKGDGIWGSPAHMRISLSLLLLGRYASPVISCKTGHAHLLLQNYFLLKMLFHDQGTYWSLWWPSFSASELDPAEGPPSTDRAQNDGNCLCVLAGVWDHFAEGLATAYLSQT